MRRITQQRQFRNDLKRQKRRGKEVEELIAAVELLAETGTLPSAYRPHQLSGNWKGVWECHIEPDWLLIYQVTPAEVRLIRAGTCRFVRVTLRRFSRADGEGVI
jgi:mRNA interferase YafQ